MHCGIGCTGSGTLVPDLVPGRTGSGNLPGLLIVNSLSALMQLISHLSELSRAVPLRAACWVHSCTCAIVMKWSYQRRINCCFMLTTVLSSHMIKTPKLLLICWVLILLDTINGWWTINYHYVWARQNAFFSVPRLTSTKFLTFVLLMMIMLLNPRTKSTKHLKKSNAACFYTPIVLKLLIIVQM